MTNAVHQFWHVSFPVRSNNSPKVYYEGAIGHDEQHARALAHLYSRRYAHATVTNREGLVATYVNGVERDFRNTIKEDSIRGGQS